MAYSRFNATGDFGPRSVRTGMECAHCCGTPGGYHFAFVGVGYGSHTGFRRRFGFALHGGQCAELCLPVFGRRLVADSFDAVQW